MLVNWQSFKHLEDNADSIERETETERQRETERVRERERERKSCGYIHSTHFLNSYMCAIVNIMAGPKYG